jgi:protein phosphatase
MRCKFLKITLLLVYFVSNILNFSWADILNYSKQNVFSMPENIGTIVKNFNGTSKYRIVCIEDLHCNKTAQENIYKIINQYKNYYKNNLKIIGEEGAIGTVDTSIISKIKNEKIQKKIINHLLNKGYISGQEIFSINNNKIKLVGLEDGTLYIKNFWQLYESFKNRNEINKIIEKTKNNINNLKLYLYPQELITFQENKYKYEQHDLSLKKYAKYLKNTAKKFHMNISRNYNQINLFVKFNGNNENLDLDVLVNEINELEYVLEKKFVKAKKNALVFLYCEKYLKLFKKYINNSVSSIELEDWMNNRDKFFYAMQNLDVFLFYEKFFVKNYELLKDYEKRMNVFYSLALKRNEIMSGNILKYFNENSACLGIIVTGGFHTQGITKLLQAKGVSYTVITPNVKNIEAGYKLYLNRLNEQANNFRQVDYSGYKNYTLSAMSSFDSAQKQDMNKIIEKISRECGLCVENMESKTNEQSRGQSHIMEFHSKYGQNKYFAEANPQNMTREQFLQNLMDKDVSCVITFGNANNWLKINADFVNGYKVSLNEKKVTELMPAFLGYIKFIKIEYKDNNNNIKEKLVTEIIISEKILQEGVISVPQGSEYLIQVGQMIGNDKLADNQDTNGLNKEIVNKEACLKIPLNNEKALSIIISFINQDAGETGNIFFNTSKKHDRRIYYFTFAHGIYKKIRGLSKNNNMDEYRIKKIELFMSQQSSLEAFKRFQTTERNVLIGLSNSDVLHSTKILWKTSEQQTKEKSVSWNNIPAINKDEDKPKGAFIVKHPVTNVKAVYIPSSGKLIVAGDLHADIDSLNKILEESNFEERIKNKEELYLVFNGDFVDRGMYNMQVLEKLFELKQKYPQNIFILRGNHELTVDVKSYINETSKMGVGPLREMSITSSEDFERRKNLLQTFYNELPIFAIIGNGIIILHGYFPLIFNTNAQIDMENINLENFFNPSYREQILWNDPSRYFSYGKDYTNSHRSFGNPGFIYNVGAKITKKILDQIGAVYLIRSHEAKVDFLFNSKEELCNVITIFSTGGESKTSFYKNICSDPAYIEIDLTQDISKKPISISENFKFIWKEERMEKVKQNKKNFQDFCNESSDVEIMSMFKMCCNYLDSLIAVLGDKNPIQFQLKFNTLKNDYNSIFTRYMEIKRRKGVVARVICVTSNRKKKRVFHRVKNLGVSVKNDDIKILSELPNNEREKYIKYTSEKNKIYVIEIDYLGAEWLHTITGKDKDNKKVVINKLNENLGDFVTIKDFVPEITKASDLVLFILNFFSDKKYIMSNEAKVIKDWISVIFENNAKLENDFSQEKVADLFLNIKNIIVGYGEDAHVLVKSVIDCLVKDDPDIKWPDSLSQYRKMIQAV